MEVKKDREIIDRIINKATEQILPSKEMLEEMLNSGKRLKIYQGFDPTADTLHIGHMVMMHKLEDFRKLGHEVIFLMGNFTATIGDPSDKKSTRQPLTLEKTNKNLEIYKEQASAIIDIDNKENPVKVLFNADWLGELKFAEILELASNFTVQQMLKRNMFQDRIENDKPIGLHEFMYPLMQGYDSVAMDVDIEIGGNDQLFNMMAGRTLQKAINQKEKIVITGKLLATNDGVKMGKSEGNMIKLSDNAKDVYGKVMAFSDALIVPGFELLTTATMEEVKQIQERLDGDENPMILKKELALRLTLELKGKKGAEEGQKFFEEAFQNRKTDVEAEVVETDAEKLTLLELLTDVTGISQSNSQARRLVTQGAVSIDGEKQDDPTTEIAISEEGILLKAGKSLFTIKKV